MRINKIFFSKQVFLIVSGKVSKLNELSDINKAIKIYIIKKKERKKKREKYRRYYIKEKKKRKKKSIGAEEASIT